jgi:hypothetical protein
LDAIKEKKIVEHHDSLGSNEPKKTVPVDTTVENKYADLLNDDSAYNKRYCILIPFIEVIGDNAGLSFIDQKILKLGFSKISMASWKRNLNAGAPWNHGWEWDQDRFGNNFLSHPMMGNFYFNDARSNGYNFWQSIPFAFVGSYMWKIFGENGTPEREDIVNTTVDGVLLGEILYRLSSNILDDRTRGRERVFREILAGVIDPMRGFNRLVQGKTFKHTNKEVYQKDRLNVTLFGGIHKIDKVNSIATGSTSGILNLQVDYGNPFEVRNRKPFDYFKFKVETDIGVGRKFVDNITGYGILSGKNVQIGKFAMLAGGFLYYDYWDNTAFELSTIAVGVGANSELPFSKTINLYTNLHFGFVPLGGNSTGRVTDTSQYRDYSFAYGGEAKFETSLALGNRATIGVVYYYFLLHLFNNTGRDESRIGTLGNNYSDILKPKVTLRIYKDLSLGFEYTLYYQNHNLSNYSIFNSSQTEEKIFLSFFFEDKQRKGHYN